MCHILLNLPKLIFPKYLLGKRKFLKGKKLPKKGEKKQNPMSKVYDSLLIQPGHLRIAY